MRGLQVKTLPALVGTELHPTADKFVVDDVSEGKLKRISTRDILFGAGLKSDRLTYHGTLAAAKTAHVDGGSEPTVFCIDQDDVVEDDLELPSTMVVVWDNLPMVSVAAGKSLTFNAMPQDPGPRKLFDLADADSHVLFGPNAVEMLRTEWFNGPGDPGGIDGQRGADECLASCRANDGGHVSTGWGKWLGCNHNVPANTRFTGLHRFATTWKNSSTDDPIIEINELGLHIDIENMTLEGEWAGDAEVTTRPDNCGILMRDVAGGEYAGHVRCHGVVFLNNHIGFRTHSSGGLVGSWQNPNISFDEQCIFITNDIAWVSNSINNNWTFDCQFYVGWVQTGGTPGDEETATGYSQYLARLVNSGNQSYSKEFAGAGWYGWHQMETITIDSGDAVTVGGTAVASFTATNFTTSAGVKGGTENISIPLTTADNTPGKIGNTVRKHLSENPAIAAFCHTTNVLGGDSRDVNLAFIDRVANDEAAAFSLAVGDVVGLTAIASSTRKEGRADRLAMGIELTGEHLPIKFDGNVDEKFGAIVINNADQLEAGLHLKGYTLQSPILMNKKGVIDVSGGRINDKAIRNGGSDGETYFGSPMFEGKGYVIPAIVNLWTESGAEIHTPWGRSPHTFTGINDGLNNGMVLFDVSTENRQVKSSGRWSFFYNFISKLRSSEAGVDPDMWGTAEFLSYDPSEDHSPVLIGNCDTNGKYTGYGYKFRRLISGLLRIAGSAFNAGYNGVWLDGPVFSDGNICITPFQTAAISGNLDEWNPGFNFMTTKVYVDMSGNAELRGMISPADAGSLYGDQYQGIWENLTGYTITVKNQYSTGNREAYRIQTPLGTDFAWHYTEAVYWSYDPIRSRWRIYRIGA